VNLSISELKALPLAAALLSAEDMVAHTPEWRGAAPGAVTYTTRSSRLVVAARESTPACLPVLTRLLDELDATASALAPPQSLRVAMLAASLRLVAGRVSSARGSSDDVLDHLAAGLRSRTGVALSVTSSSPFEVVAPQVAALILVQLAANAERHDRAAALQLEAGDGIFTMTWRSGSSTPGAVTARRRADRARWGLGFARVAADAIGAVVFPPVRRSDGSTVATVELGLQKLALPVCAVRDGVVHKATGAWDDETELAPGCAVQAGGTAAKCLDLAGRDEGLIVTVNGWCARRTGGVTWIAIPPDGIVDRARDVLDGMVHERALWENVPLGRHVRIVALASLLSALLGAPLPRVPALAWNAAVPAIAGALGLSVVVPRFDGMGALDPNVALFLALEIGEGFTVDGDDLLLRVRPDQRDHDLARLFLAPGDDALRLS
jgi:hypothetical protein